MRDELPNVDVVNLEQPAFLRQEESALELAYELLVKEPLVVVLPSDHRLATLESIRVEDMIGETFLGVSDTAPALRAVIDKYQRRSGIDFKPTHAGGQSGHGDVFCRFGGFALFAAYAQNFLPWSVTNRPLKGDAPTINLVLGYNRANQSPILKLLLSKLNELVTRVFERQ